MSFDSKADYDDGDPYAYADSESDSGSEEEPVIKRSLTAQQASDRMMVVVRLIREGNVWQFNDNQITFLEKHLGLQVEIPPIDYANVNAYEEHPRMFTVPATFKNATMDMLVGFPDLDKIDPDFFDEDTVEPSDSKKTRKH